MHVKPQEQILQDSDILGLAAVGTEELKVLFGGGFSGLDERSG